MEIKYLGARDFDSKSRFYIYACVMDDGYEMGLEVFDSSCENVLATLFHWNSEGQRHTLRHFAADEEKTSFLQVYFTGRGRYFNYGRHRVYLPSKDS